MKYKFNELNLDEYELVYTNKDGIEVVKPFKRTVKLASKLQSGEAEARMELYSYLTSMGKTKDDFIIKKEENGKVIYDETNYREFESSFLIRKQFEIAMSVYEELFGVGLEELLMDMGLSEETAEDFRDNIEKFSTELREILINGKVKTPSPTNKDKTKQNNI